ncbi:PREDICTED: uncharacterized protein LOC104804897 [Tarenaya hassleriana]|uniref:uncharacterized protein LOC104804897 n=1 Tax=Tarenaya hassleriana TaxID=28532 RepID=UPI00053C6034|nr:PREDICTED: uncharacterized protein LOC104804897 [Tarenaya hassleriana]
MCSAFLWSGAPDSAKGAKVSWAAVCTPKASGGLALRRLTGLEQNPVFEAHLDLVHERGLSMGLVGASKPDPWEAFLVAPRTWEGKLGMAQAVEASTNGQISSSLSGSMGPRLLGVPLASTVAEAASSDGWLLHPARSNVAVSIHQALIAHPLPRDSSSPNRFYWSGMQLDSQLLLFSTKSTWLTLYPAPPRVPWKNVVWFARSVPKHSFMTWLVVRNRIPTRDRTNAWGINTPTCCVLCGDEDETVSHFSFDAPTLTIYGRVF